MGNGKPDNRLYKDQFREMYEKRRVIAYFQNYTKIFRNRAVFLFETNYYDNFFVPGVTELNTLKQSSVPICNT
ncbi:hypothetical protein Psch_01644 [Pelotomaculum schinkii]|uniref:Uncharacterized protein n=1 Tax=Pelotomaculum schinkii TaxID=78350 RepID=A0A4Y7RH46_9FIRM|nr:hypothetical protein Psch_01644 [Pelotomaculum schinkii]TEB15780.1 hypothetical protein Psfp_01865 [Pelotomaculum sp. FP]